MMRGRTALLGMWLLAAGCGEAGLLRLPDGALTGLPAEGRRFIFDSENAIVVALDGVDQAKEGLTEADEQIQRAERSLKKARSQEPTRGTDLGVQAAEARLRYARAQRDLGQGRLAVARSKVHRARAELELDRARMVVNYDLVAVRDFRLQPYEDQAAAAKRAVEEEQAREAALLQKLREQETGALQARLRYVEKTGDHDSGVWLD